MVCISIGNNWGSIYTEALKKAGISFLLEIDNTTNLTFADEDFKRAEAIMEKQEMNIRQIFVNKSKILK